VFTAGKLGRIGFDFYRIILLSTLPYNLLNKRFKGIKGYKFNRLNPVLKNHI